MPIRLLKTAARLAVLITSIVLALWFYRGYLARSLPPLEIWHTYEAENEFRARDFPQGITFKEYAELEDRLYEELDDAVYSQPNTAGRYNRYDKSSESYPGDRGQQWNRSFEMPHSEARGGVLFIHGASDSPYSTRALAQKLHEAGLYVLSIRLPGNGTIPSGLRHATLDDWIAVTRMGVRHVRDSIAPELPLYIAGYSIGGALAVDYTLDAIDDETLANPDRLFLYTPAIGVSAAARFSSWDLALAKLPVFEKFNWLSVEPEFDPYKYNSFAKRAGDITYLLTTQLQQKLSKLKDPSLLPPIIAFQSLVDSTIRVPSLVDDLYGKLAANGSELVLFDINRAHDIEHFIKKVEFGFSARLESSALNNFGYTLVTNVNGHSVDITARTKAAGETEFGATPLGLSWPNSFYSLSHVSLMFEPDDRWYGGNPSDKFKLGTLAPRGETAILSSPIGRFMRLRHNPFFDYLAERTLAFCEACER